MMFGTRRYDSWGRFPKAPAKQVIPLQRQAQDSLLANVENTVLPFGYGRSYGDVCLNAGGTLLDVTPLNHFISFDTARGILRAEAGVSLAEILDVIVPQGWFLPVTPGTKFVSLGGAIANDVHGKNHHAAGTFGCHVTQLELLRSDGSRLRCAPDENADLFAATIGGMGLTGVILWAEITLKRIITPLVKMESLRFANMDEFFSISEASQDSYEYTVSWVDCTTTGQRLGRGRFTRGNFYDPPLGVQPKVLNIPSIPVPLDLPSWTMNRFTVRAFNELYYHIHQPKVRRGITHYNPFFYPLDTLTDWYRIYGRAGFLQYQFVLDHYEHGIEPVKEIFRRIAASGQGTFLVVFKTFGDRPSPGMMSFPRRGVTLALDFANRGSSTLRLLDDLDSIVFSAEGALYPGKDARMSPEAFRRSFPQWQHFAQYIDPKFSSSFWRRVTDC